MDKKILSHVQVEIETSGASHDLKRDVLGIHPGVSVREICDNILIQIEDHQKSYYKGKHGSFVTGADNLLLVFNMDAVRAMKHVIYHLDAYLAESRRGDLGHSFGFHPILVGARLLASAYQSARRSGDRERYAWSERDALLRVTRILEDTTSEVVLEEIEEGQHEPAFCWQGETIDEAGYRQPTYNLQVEGYEVHGESWLLVKDGANTWLDRVSGLDPETVRAHLEGWDDEYVEYFKRENIL